MRSIDPSATADAIIGQLKSTAANIHKMPKFALRQLLGTVIGRIMVDMETKAVELQMMVPLAENFFGGSISPDAMRLVGNSASSTSCQTHPPIAMPWGSLTCVPQKIQSRVCYKCRRKAA